MALVQVTGLFGGAFSGTGGSAATRVIGSDSDLMGTACTIGGFVKRVIDSNEGGFLRYIDVSGGEIPWGVAFTQNSPADGFWRPTFTFQGSAATQTHTPSQFADSVDWQHLVVTYEIGGNLLYYVEGVLVNTVAATLANRAPTMSAGSEIQVTGGEFYLDSFEFFDYILTPAQIASWKQVGPSC